MCRNLFWKMLPRVLFISWIYVFSICQEIFLVGPIAEHSLVGQNG